MRVLPGRQRVNGTQARRLGCCGMGTDYPASAPMKRLRAHGHNMLRITAQWRCAASFCVLAVRVAFAVEQLPRNAPGCAVAVFRELVVAQTPSPQPAAHRTDARTVCACGDLVPKCPVRVDQCVHGPRTSAPRQCVEWLRFHFCSCAQKKMRQTIFIISQIFLFFYVAAKNFCSLSL